MPRRALTSGRKFSTTTSAFAARRRNTASPLGSLRLSEIARLLRCRFWKSDPCRGPPGCSPAEASVRASILMTLAPQSANCRTAVGPERTRVRSSTVKRERAVEARGKGIKGFQRLEWERHEEHSIARAARDAITIHNITVAQLHSHQRDFHLM